MNKDKILGVIRHILTFGGGFLAGKDILPASDIEAATGAIVTLVGVIWSVIAKKKSDGVPVNK